MHADHGGRRRVLASRSGRSAAGCQDRVPMLGAVTPATLVGAVHHQKATTNMARQIVAGTSIQRPTAAIAGEAPGRGLGGGSLGSLGDGCRR